jgi:glyoxylase-like metal-dependent hydrolase (beta-lactamase superfamily II)
LAEPAPGHPEIERIVAPNPGPMTLEGTNTYVIDTDDGVYVIDPGPDDPGHLEAVREAAESRGEIAGVLLTHGHADHTAGAEAFGEPVLWGTALPGDEAAGLAAKAPNQHPDAVGPFGLIPTPGHAADHVCFVFGRVCFCGDLILGTGSSIVPPRAAGGSLADYMGSLRRIAELDLDLLAPGHGPLVTDPEARITEYVEHRLDRERRLVAALAAGERSRARLVETVRDDVPEPLRPAAAVAMQAHLEKLIEEGRLGPSELRD